MDGCSLLFRMELFGKYPAGEDNMDTTFAIYWAFVSGMGLVIDAVAATASAKGLLAWKLFTSNSSMIWWCTTAVAGTLFFGLSLLSAVCTAMAIENAMVYLRQKDTPYGVHGRK